jgi:hypothetical protein
VFVRSRNRLQTELLIASSKQCCPWGYGTPPLPGSIARIVLRASKACDCKLDFESEDADPVFFTAITT